MKKVDLLTPLGVLLGLAAITIAVTQIADLEKAVGFISLASFITVIGGVTASVLVHFSLAQLKLTWTVLKEAFFQREYNVDELISKLVQFSSIARKDGLIALERRLEEMDEPFLERGVALTIDGVDQETIRDIMLAEIAATDERLARGRKALEKAGEFAPAWGMIGTIVGLVLMLQTLNSPEALGPKMAIALVTTFYGSILANLVFIPLAGKLENQAEEQIFYKQIMIEGVLGLHAGYTPSLLEEKLSVFRGLDSGVSPLKSKPLKKGREDAHGNKTA